MNIDGDVLIISSHMDASEVEELKNFVEPRLEFIEEIVFEEENPKFFTTSLLFQLLFAIKKSRPEITIKIIEENCSLFSEIGELKWIR